MRIIHDKINELSNMIGKNDYYISIETLVDTLYYRLTIMRLGEEDNNTWWESSILGEVGRRNLEKFFPNTFNRQRYDIAKKIVNEKEKRDITIKYYTSLFNFGYKFESEIFKPFLQDISKLEDWKVVLNLVEEIKGKKFSEPWVREFYDISKLPISAFNNKNIIELGVISEEFYNNRQLFDDTIKSFLSIYDKCLPGNIITPYYKRKVAI